MFNNIENNKEIDNLDENKSEQQQDEKDQQFIKQQESDFKIDLSFLNTIQEIQIIEQKIIKHQMRQGESLYDLYKKDEENIQIWFYMELRLFNGKLIKNQQRKNIQKIKLWNDYYVKGIHYSIQSMQEGESSWFKIHLDFYNIDLSNQFEDPQEYSAQLQHSFIYAKFDVLQIKIKNQQFIKKPTTFQEKQTFIQISFQELDEIKQKANLDFRSENYLKSVQGYTKLLNKVKHFPTRYFVEFDDETRLNLINQQEEYKITTLNNLALTYINLKDYKSAQKYIQLVLDIHPHQLKSNYLLAKIYFNQNQYQKTIQQYQYYIELLQQQNSDSNFLHSEIQKINNIISSINIKKQKEFINEKNVCSHIISNMSQQEQKDIIEQKKKLQLQQQQKQQ